MAYFILESCIGCSACLKICPSHAITGEKKALHTIDAAVCIDCGACGRVCPAAAVQDNFGQVTQALKKRDWDRPMVDLECCMSCGICVDTCPAGALEVTLQKVGSSHLFPSLDESLCMGCGFCAQDCPVGAIFMAPRAGQTLSQES